jgi:hypothetical protein
VFFDRKGVASTRTPDQTSQPSSSSPCCPAPLTDAAPGRGKRQRNWAAVALAAAMAAPVAVVGLAQLQAGGAEAEGAGKAAGAKPAVAAPKSGEVADELKALKVEWEKAGCTIPYMGFNLIPLSVIPEIRITDKGLVKVPEMILAPLFD